jgi:hypothetical protein
MEYKIPPHFYFDHLSRECGKSGKIVRSTKNYLIVDLDDSALSDLLSDANYYSESGDISDPSIRGLVTSARATLNAIDKAAC